MFKKILVANRGEIAVRLIRACRDLGIATVAVYEPNDINTMHVRLADECIQIAEGGYNDPHQLLQGAIRSGADAIHAGYAFLAENAPFVRACEDAGLTFIGPSSVVLAALGDKIKTLDRVRAAGFPTIEYSSLSFDDGEDDGLRTEAERLGFPLIVKSSSGGRGRGTRLIRSAAQLDEMVHNARASARPIYGHRRVHLERALLPSRYIEVQLLGDRHGNLIHLGERDSSIQRNNQKLIEESPAPYLTSAQREKIWDMAIAIGRLLHCTHACAVEFLMDGGGNIYFTEVKPRIQMEHPVSELVSHIDIIREQIRIAAGETLAYTQADVQLRGVAMQCRINAEDPSNGFLPSPGTLDRLQIPGGPHVRVDTYAYLGCEVSARYDVILAKLAVWGTNRDECIQRLRRALEDFIVGGIKTNLSLVQRAVAAPVFLSGNYNTEFSRTTLKRAKATNDELRNLAAAAAVAYLLRNQAHVTTLPDRLLSGWHRDSRSL